MKHLGKLAILGALIAASTSLASATSIQIGSYSTTGSSNGDTNTALSLAGEYLTGASLTGLPGLGALGTPSSSTTYTLSPGTVWAGPLADSTWVGSAMGSGPGGTVNPAYGYYEYQTTINNTSGSTLSGTLNVLADDTVEVLLNGADILNFGTLGNDSTCSQGAPGCLTSTESSLLINLGTGENTLDFIVEQAGDQTGAPGTDPSGLDFDATLNNNSCLTPTPEPSSLLLLGTGLLGAAEMARRKFAAKLSA